MLSRKAAGSVLLLFVILIAAGGVWLWSPSSAGGIDPENQDLELGGQARTTEEITTDDPHALPAAPEPERSPISEDVGGPPTGPVDLRVRVVTAAGSTVDGIPVCLFAEHPEHGVVPMIGDLRLTGRGVDARGRQDADAPAAPGEARWAPEVEVLRNVLQFHEKGPSPGETPTLTVGILLAGTELPRIPVAVPWPAEPIQLVLPDEALGQVQPLRVEVRFADGSPAPGIPVVTRAIPSEPAFGNVAEERVGVSDADGVVLVPRDEQLRYLAMFSTMLRMRPAGPDGGDTTELERMFEYTVAPDLPLTTRPLVPFASVPTGPETVVVDLPPVARLEVSVTGPQAEPFDVARHGLTYRLHWTREGEPPRYREGRETVAGTPETPRFDLGWVGVGMDLDLNVWPLDGWAPSTRIPILSPSIAGEVELILVEIGEPYPLLVATLLDEHDAPFAGRLLEYVVREERLEGPDAERGRRWRRIESDGQGRIAWKRASPPTTRQVLEVRWESLSGSLRLPLALAESPTLAVERGEPRRYDVGELRLSTGALPSLGTAAEPGLLGEGIVTDLAGRPLAGVEVRAREAENQHNLEVTRTDDQGRFELLSQRQVPFRLSLYQAGYVSYRGPVHEPGARGLRFELAPAGTLRGSLAGGTSPFALRITAWVGKERRSARFESEGQFRIEGLPLGTARVEVTGEDLEFLFLHIDDVEVREGVHESPELQELDLASLVREVWATFERADGGVADGYVWVSTEGHGRHSIDIAGRKHRKLLLPRSAQKALFEHAGMSEEAWLGPAEGSGAQDITIVFQPR